MHVIKNCLSKIIYIITYSYNGFESLQILKPILRKELMLILLIKNFKNISNTK